MHYRPFETVVTWVIRHHLTPAGLRPRLFRLIGHQVPNTATVLAGLRTGGDGKLVMGPNTFISDDCFLDLSADITIGDGVDIGARASLVTAGHEYGNPLRRAGARQDRPIRIEDGVWLGARSTILGGVTIGAGVVVAAGALVTKDCLPHGLYAGVPARRIKDLPTGPDQHPAAPLSTATTVSAE